MTAAPVEAVVFDLGGVVLDSPLHEIARFEEEHRLQAGIVNRTVFGAGAGGAWARYERGELVRPEFLPLLAAELAVAGATVDTAELMSRIDASIRPRPAMIRAIRLLRGAGISTAAITNNWEPFPAGGLRDEFDVFLESVTEGVRKPEPEIYRRCLDRLDVAPSRAVMLDDLGPNLKPALELGMHTIKVGDAATALEELSRLVGIELTATGAGRIST